MVPAEKKLVPRRSELAYLGIVCAVFAALCLLRPDLVSGAFRATSASLAAGGVPALKVMAEIILFGGIITLTARTVPFGAAPAQDIPIVLSAALFGYLAEAWGTRSGLWTYYTGERPPLWIIPAWPIGALVIERLARRTGKIMERLMTVAAREWLYRAWLTAFCCIFISFSTGSLLNPAGFLVALTLALALFSRRDRNGRDAAVLFTGTLCVFFADLWGTTNHCWTYHVQGRAYGPAYGISFGAMFDPAIVLAGIKAAEAVTGRLKRFGV